MLVKFGPLFPRFGANIRKIFELPPPKTNLSNWHFQAPLSGTSKGSFGPTLYSPNKAFAKVEPSYKAAGRASGLSWSSSGLRPPNQPTNRQQDTNGWVNEGDPGILIWLVVSTHLKKSSQVGNLPQIVVNIKNIWNHYLDNESPAFSSPCPTSCDCWSLFLSCFHWICDCCWMQKEKTVPKVLSQMVANNGDEYHGIESAKITKQNKSKFIVIPK